MSTHDKKDYALVAQKMKSRSRRTAGPQQYTLPKPYRRTAGPDDRPARSKSTLAMIALAGLLIAGLIAELVAIVQENMRVRKLPVVAAIVPEVRPPVVPAAATSPAAPDMTPAAAFPAVPAPSPAPMPAPAPEPALAQAPPEPGVTRAGAVDPALAPEPAAEHHAGMTPASLPAPGHEARPAVPAPPAMPTRPAMPAAPPVLALKKVRPGRTVVKPAAPAPDPDVVLVTAILMLTAKPDLSEQVTVCDPGMAKEASCTDIHGMVP